MDFNALFLLAPILALLLFTKSSKPTESVNPVEPQTKREDKVSEPIKCVKEEYTKWLQWYVSQGFKPTHYYDYDFDHTNWVVAEKGKKYLSGCGARAIYVVAPEGVNDFKVDDLGQGKIYQYDKSKPVIGTYDYVPQYKDVCVDYEHKNECLIENLNDAKKRLDEAVARGYSNKQLQRIIRDVKKAEAVLRGEEYIDEETRHKNGREEYEARLKTYDNPKKYW